MRRYALFAYAIVFAGCSAADIVRELARDRASACGKIVITGAGGLLAIPGPVPGGGYGQVEIEFCRTHADRAVIVRDSDGLRIVHYDAADKENR